MSRAFLMVMDSVGIGGAPDAASYGDTGSDTFGNIVRACAAGRGDRAGLRSGPLLTPNLDRLGLRQAARAASNFDIDDVHARFAPLGTWGAAREKSLGKDTPSGHWEIAGVPVTFAWGYFPQTIPSFPKLLTDDLIARCQLPGLLGNKHASGTEIIAELGAEHMATGKPIVYTSADSVLQIAAHEVTFGLEPLRQRRLFDEANPGFHGQ